MQRPWLATMAVAVASFAAAHGARAASGPVAVFPSPATGYNLPGTQIAFRGVTAREIGQVHVVGSVTGPHSGHVESDSDGQGGSFLPDKPFMPGETVTVSTHLDVLGGSNGTFSFGVADTWGVIPPGKLPLAPAGSSGVQHFRSRPDLQPAAVTVTEDSAPASEGDIFVAPQFGPVQDGPMILDPHGNLMWFLPYPVSRNTLITDFRVQNLFGQPVLTWWQGNTNSGHGRGEGVIFDQHYRQVATVKAANGLAMGLHELLITPQGDAYIDSPSLVHLPGVGKPAVDSVVQEIDIKTGLVLFEWHAMDHVRLSASYFTPKSPGHIFDPYHVNSIALDADGNPIVSMRNTSAVYKINHETGRVMWTLGGKDSSFRMGAGTSTWGQHDAIVQPDGSLTLFDDGAGPPTVHPYSRGIREALDTSNMAATLLREYDHTPRISADFEGSVQELPGGDVFVGWGQQPYFSEYTNAGQQIFDAHFTAPTSSYRAYRFPWTGKPLTPPALAVSPNPDGSTSLYASWNGATNASAWRVLAGSSPSQLSPIGGAAKNGFESQIGVHSAAPYFAVQALDPSGSVLGTSRPAATPAHIALYGHSAFVPASGFSGIPASCFANHPCHIATTITAGQRVIARTGTESLGEGAAGILYFQLSRSGRWLLQHARTRRLSVNISARDSSGTTASTTINLAPFYTTGRGPRRSITNSPTVRIIGVTHFVSNGWVGGILAGCVGGTPCHVKTTLYAGRTSIARTGSEFLGANELGYLLFTLTPQGHLMLAHAPGNQLGAHVTVSEGNSTAGADVALVAFR
jgi:Arylsulfotransferase (ASST)